MSIVCVDSIVYTVQNTFVVCVCVSVYACVVCVHMVVSYFQTLKKYFLLLCSSFHSSFPPQLF